MRHLLEKATQTHTLTQAEIVALLRAQDPQPLFQAADRVRQKYVGDGVYLRGLVEFSSFCKNDCMYCGLRRSNTHAKRYRLTPKQILQTARQAVGRFFCAFI